MMTPKEKLIIEVDADLRDLIPGFLSNRQKDIKSILQALQGGDYETIRFLGHSMKGFGGGYGFAAISDIGRALELAARNRANEEILRQVSELTTYLERVEIVYV